MHEQTGSLILSLQIKNITWFTY